MVIGTVNRVIPVAGRRGGLAHVYPHAESKGLGRSRCGVSCSGLLRQEMLEDGWPLYAISPHLGVPSCFGGRGLSWALDEEESGKRGSWREEGDRGEVITVVVLFEWHLTRGPGEPSQERKIYGARCLPSCQHLIWHGWTRGWGLAVWERIWNIQEMKNL